MTRKRKTDKKPSTKKPRVHKDLDGFEISIDSFGELKSNMSIEKINEFLNKNVEDKKLVEREDYEDIKSKKESKKKPQKKKKG